MAPDSLSGVRYEERAAARPFGQQPGFVDPGLS
jgi:hypothetical protein